MPRPAERASGKCPPGQRYACSGSCSTESSAVSPCPTVPSWHVQDKSVIDRTEIVRIGGDDMQVPLPRAEGNRYIDHIGVTRPAAHQADGTGDRVIQGDDLRALVAEQHSDPSLSRSAAPRLR